MNWTLTLRNISVITLLVILSACGSNNEATDTPVGEILPTAGETSTEAPAVTEPTLTQEPSGTETSATAEGPVSSGGGMPVAGSGLCANAYYPVREGATWTYQSSGGPLGGYGFTDTITAVREDGFTLTSQFDDLTRTQEWACRTEGLVALQLGGTSAATLNSQDMQLTLDVGNVSGVTFPSEIAPGDQWEHALEFTGTMNVGGQEIEANGSARSTFNAIGNESVTVPAGTFDAIKIRVDSTININGVFQGVAVPVTISSPYDYWFVQGVGWVKASGTGDVGGESFSETIELQSYNIP